MNNSSKTISLIIAAGIAGVAAFKIANASFTATLPGAVVLGVIISAAVIGLAAHDYSRRFNSLRTPGRLLRPGLSACPAPRSAAKSGRDEKLAA